MIQKTPLALGVAAATISVLLGTLTGATAAPVGGADRADAERGSAQEARTRAALTITPAAVGQRANGAAARVHPAVAILAPARPGRLVQVQRKNGSRWATVAQARQKRAARMDFVVPEVRAGSSSQFRVVGSRHRGAGRSVSKPVRVSAPRLTFGDDFGGNRLDRAKWATRHQPFHGRRTCAKPADGLVRVGGGVATLGVKRVKQGRWVNGRNQCPNGVWHNAMIGTAQGSRPFLQKYGTFAARIKFQEARGMHGAFWLQGPGVTGAEIDVIEHYGVGAKPPMTIKVHHTRRGGTVRTATRDRVLPMLGGRKATQWNVYSVTWTPKQYVFRVNGKVAWRTNKPHVSSAEQELILSLLTSDYATGRIQNPRSTMQVDWVRAWAG